MLEITIPERELYDEKVEEFVVEPKVELVLEHSLVSLSKWESKWEVSFLNNKEHTTEQTMDYIRCMNLTSGVPDSVFERLDEESFDKINNYISAKMTATWFSDQKKGNSREVITSELIYYWMISLTIPFECQYWHLNRLLTLIRVCNEKNQPAKKVPRKEAAARNRELNRQRRAAMNTSG